MSSTEVYTCIFAIVQVISSTRTKPNVYMLTVSALVQSINAFMQVGNIDSRTHQGSNQHVCRGKLTFFHFLVFIIAATRGTSLPDNTERTLIEKLLRNYDVNARPTSNPQDSVQVRVGFALDGIIQVDEESQTITSTGKVTFVWNDEYLSWNETTYRGVKMLALDRSRVWLPDAVIPSRNGGDFIINESKGYVNVNSGGQLTLTSRGTFVTFCSMAMTKFPYDQHKCSIIIEPHVSTSQQQTFSAMKKNSTSSFQQITTWSFLRDSWSCSVNGQSDLTRYSTCRLLFTVTREGERRFIISAILLIVLSIMSCFVFFLSAKTMEKMVFILVVFVAYTFVFTFIQESFRDTINGYSYLYIYFVTEFGIISLMSIIAIFTINITCKDDLNIPPCLRCLARVVTCKLKKHVNVISSERNDIIRAPGVDMAYKNRTGKFSDSSGSEYVYEITWVDVAAGLDRLFFILFLIVNIVLPVIVFNMINS
ncbi:acetylcholine receptor subunit alpha-like [Ylistrum balloti]|uniref:acetylcholine receptor subunit alpha-like n=1 Tax=Ylistrum balloti TaxID=509963 RepID=UPI002905BCA8|nr:acetylcholine receptor subunit alpha-like [Ylistrum balloti]